MIEVDTSMWPSRFNWLVLTPVLSPWFYVEPFTSMEHFSIAGLEPVVCYDARQADYEDWQDVVISTE